MGAKKGAQGSTSSQIARYLVRHVGVEDFAFDYKPAFLPVSLAALASAEVAADGRSLSRGCYLEQGGKTAV